MEARGNGEDRGRAVAPLRAAEDAITIVTDTLTLDEVVAKLVAEATPPDLA